MSELFELGEATEIAPEVFAPEVIRVSWAAYKRAKDSGCDESISLWRSRLAVRMWCNTGHKEMALQRNRGEDRESAFNLAMFAAHTWAVEHGYVGQDDPY